ncbi:MAG: hypothetical protein V4548_10415 [Bacteroidota bacterium]
MKNSLLMLAVVGCISLTSCNNDDENGSNNLTSDLTGTYELTSMTVPTSEDFDNDGDSHTNLVSEGSCYNDSWISFHSDGTYDESYSYSSMGSGGLTLECNTRTTSGTYTQNDDQIITVPEAGSGESTATYTFNAATHILTRTENNGDYSGWNQATSLWANLTGNLQIVLTKYTENENDNGNTDDDENNTDSTSHAELIGDFDLSAMIVGTAQDLNNDGTSSTNLMSESNCYSASHITFNSNGTYSENSSYNLISGSGLSLTCNSEIVTGTWSRHGNEIVTRSTTNVITHFMINTSNNTISSSDHNDNYATYNLASHLYAMLTGNVDYTYEKD